MQTKNLRSQIEEILKTDKLVFNKVVRDGTTYQIISHTATDQLLALFKKEVSSIKKEELDDSSVQLLTRHERETYNEDVVGYNKAIDDVLSLLTEQKED